MRFSTSWRNSAMSISSCFIRSWWSFFSCHDSIPSTIIERSYSSIKSTSSRSNRSNILFKLKLFASLLYDNCSDYFPNMVFNTFYFCTTYIYTTVWSLHLYESCCYTFLYNWIRYFDGDSSSIHISVLNE